MSNVKIDFSKEIGKIKAMHAVNNGPKVAGKDQKCGNQDYYQMARIPYARVHDAAFYAPYGGEHTVDVHAIFPNFNADVNDPQSYDFACTDNYMAQLFKYGAKPFYRLGSKIEHGVKKYGTLVPPDFQKWAEICEHIIAHYTEGWADGFNYDIEYWEIWNEPDLDTDDSKNKRTWQGTEVEFAEFYLVASKHLKKRFPTLKIGGPAIAGDEAWLERFFERIKGRGVTFDFFSWHWYWTEPKDLSAKATRIRKILEKYGYGNAESICNEWNYIRGWVDEFVYSIKQIIGMKGAAFTGACMAECQNNPSIDMLMYYDARPCGMNGLFDFYTQEPLKGYYPFYLFANLYELKNQVEATSDSDDVYVVGAKSGGACGIFLVYYTENDNKGADFVTLDIAGEDMSNAKIYVTDETKTMFENKIDKFENGKITLRLERNTIVYIEK
ncbi:MAG: hypothetical protein IJA82_02615 [Clostridia bacterium]|nr:hypothetical protein [Clostridia bacterium]